MLLDNNIVPSSKTDNKDYTNNINLLRDHHRGIRDNFERLERLAAKGPNSQDFIEPKVQGLWRIALANNFTEDELSSIKAELHHFESRLLKLRHLNAEHALHLEKFKVKLTIKGCFYSFYNFYFSFWIFFLETKT